MAAGDSASGVAVSPDGGSVYVTNELDANLSQYDRGAGGALAPKSPPTVVAGHLPEEVAVSPDGGSVYVTTAADDMIFQYDVGPGGALKPKSPPAVATGDFPRGLAVSPDGGSVYVVNVAGDSVFQYDVGAGGALAPKSPPTPLLRGRRPGGGGGQPGRQERLRRESLAAPPSPSTTSMRAGRSRPRARPGGRGCRPGGGGGQPGRTQRLRRERRKRQRLPIRRRRGRRSRPRARPRPPGDGPFRVAVSPLPGVPTSKDQCKNGGWRKFPRLQEPGRLRELRGDWRVEPATGLVGSNLAEDRRPAANAIARHSQRGSRTDKPGRRSTSTPSSPWRIGARQRRKPARASQAARLALDALTPACLE